MSVRIVPARSGKGFEYDIRFVWPEGGRLRERGKCPTTGKDASKRWAEQRERAVAAAGKGAYTPLGAKPAPASSSLVPTFAEFWPLKTTLRYMHLSRLTYRARGPTRDDFAPLTPKAA